MSRAVTTCGPVAALAAVATMLSACGGGAGPPMPLGQIVHSDAASRTVTMAARAAYGGQNGEMNFDGYSNGALTVHIPFGWLVEVDCHNDSHLLRHSCAVVANAPASLGPRPTAFPEASSPDPSAGSTPGSASTFEFVADRAGTYRIACLVHGHEIDGMWDYLVVDRSVVPAATVNRG